MTKAKPTADYKFLIDILNFNNFYLDQHDDDEERLECERKQEDVSFCCNGCEKQLPKQWIFEAGIKKEFNQRVIEQQNNTSFTFNLGQDNVIDFVDNQTNVERGKHGEIPYPDKVNLEKVTDQIQQICICSKCQKFYCLDCDIFIHETLLSCPTCS